jgi:hypothetical protein
MKKVVAALLAVAAAPPADRLDAVLKRWESAPRAARQFHSRFTWTGPDPYEGENAKLVWHGEVAFQSPDRLRVEVKDEQGRPLLLVLLAGGKARVYRYYSRQHSLASLPVGVSFHEAVERCGEEGFGFACWIKALLGPPKRGVGSARFVPRLETDDPRRSHVVLVAKHLGQLPWDEEWRVVLDNKDGLVRQFRCRKLTVDFEEPDQRPLPASAWEPPFTELPKGWTRLAPRPARFGRTPP